MVFRLLASFVLCCLATAASARPAGWVFLELPTLGGNVSWATAVNNAGQVVGWSGVAKGESSDRDPEFHAFVYENGVMRDLGRAGDNSSAWSISDAGQVAGLSFADGAWVTGRDARSLGVQATPYGVNRYGVVAGTYDRGGEFRAFAWRDGILSELGTLGGAWSQGEAINDKGAIVGSSSLASGPIRGFVHSDGRMRALGTLGGPHSQAFDVNDHGAVVGSSGNTRGGVEAFIDDGVMRPLFTTATGLDIAEAYAINNRKQVVGTLNDAGFLWDGGRLTMLRDLLTEEQRAAWGVLTPMDINDRGWIVGVASTAGINGIPGGYRRGFVLKSRSWWGS